MKQLRLFIFISIFSLGMFTSCAQNKKSNSGVVNASVEEFDEGITKGKDIVILDVRTPGEYAEGHIANAVNINYYDDNFASMVKSKIDSSKTVYVYCKGGVRSAKACKILQDEGYLNLVNLKAGFDSWVDAGKGID